MPYPVAPLESARWRRPGSVATAVAGSGKTLTLGTLTLADGTGLASNYSLASGTFDINSRQVNIAGSRTYDGTTTVSETCKKT